MPRDPPAAPGSNGKIQIDISERLEEGLIQPGGMQAARFRSTTEIDLGAIASGARSVQPMDATRRAVTGARFTEPASGRFRRRRTCRKRNTANGTKSSVGRPTRYDTRRLPRYVAKQITATEPIMSPPVHFTRRAVARKWPTTYSVSIRDASRFCSDITG